MKKYEIVLKSIVDVKNFVNITNCYDFDIELEAEGHMVDAKSIMRIFSIDLSKPVMMHVDTDDTADFEKKIAQFIRK